MSDKNYLFRSGQDWDKPLLNKIWEEIEIVAREELDIIEGRDYYKPIVEIVSAEQMIDAYAAVGLPNYYNHWSFGKDFTSNFEKYKAGEMGLAYEIVINSAPCRGLLMEENDATMQALVLAHAMIGHNFVFKNNQLFKTWTEPDAIVDYINFAKEFVRKCEERYGVQEVEWTLDSCHALMNHGVDFYKRKHYPKMSQDAAEAARKLGFEQTLQEYDDLMQKTLPEKPVKNKDNRMEPQENILYFIEKHSPNLPQWKRELIRIVRKMATYFYPQSQTQVLNEGFATFTHHYIMTRLEEKGLIDSGSYLSFLKSHTSVIMQPGFDSPYYSGGFNPYALGFAIYTDLRRICTDPTDEDRKWFPNLIGRNWVEVVKEAASNYNDESFLMQYLSPKVMRDLQMFQIEVDLEDSPIATVTEIQDDIGYQNIREAVAASRARINMVPNIQVVDVDLSGDRVLTLQYFPYEVDGVARDLHSGRAIDTTFHVGQLWGYEVDLMQEVEGEMEVIAFYERALEDEDEQ